MHLFTRKKPTTYGIEAFCLLVCGLLSALMYGLAWWFLPLRRLGIQQLYTLGSLAKERPGRGLPISLALGSTVLVALYIGGSFVVRRLLLRPSGNKRLIQTMIVLLPLMSAVPLILTYPFTTLDLYGYLFRGLMLGRYGANVFAVTPHAFQHDPLYWYTIWRDSTAGYGPMWETLGGVTARLVDIIGPQSLPPASGQNDIVRFAHPLLAQMIGFKLLGLISVLLCATMIWLGLRGAPGQTDAPENTRLAWLGVYVWLWNPLVLWELVCGGHNDGWMLLWILAAFALLRFRQARGALLALTFGALFKYPAALFGPAVLAAAVHLWLQEAHERGIISWRYVAIRLVQSAALCGTLAVLCFWPFWFGPGTFSNTMTRERWFNASASALLDIWLRTRMPWPNVDPWLLASRVAMVAIVATSLWAGWRTWRYPEHAASAVLPVALCLLLASNVFQPWYITWTLALVALQPARTRVVLGGAMLALGGWWTYLATDFVQPHVLWKTDSLRWQALLLVCIYGLALLVLVFKLGTHLVRPQALRRTRQERVQST